MADNYRDLGMIGQDGQNFELANTNTYTQVYKATHKGEARLPYMDRSFISFSYGGKDIEDYDLIASVAGDRMEFNGYADFDNLTSSYDVIHGLFYWGSYYRTNSITFNLATDGMEQKKLDEFLYWFSAGKVRELILAEHPNRAIMARVSEPPHLSLLPFEKKVLVNIGNRSYNTSTTVYKGTIQLVLVMDEPHWYSKLNIFGKRDKDGIYRDIWYDVTTGREHNVLDIPDALKIVYEDGIPLSSMINSTMLLGEDIFATVSEALYSCIIAVIDLTEYEEHSTLLAYYDNGLDKGLEDQYYKGAVIFDEDTLLGARVSGALMSEESGVEIFLPFNDGASAISLYYSGTAPSPTLMRFKLYPRFHEQSGYICSPANSYASSVGKPYNTITLECTTKKEFHFTTPNILTSYNQTALLFKTMVKEGMDWVNVRETIRESIWHSGVRAWANRVIDMYDTEDSDGTIAAGTDPTQMIDLLGFMFKDDGGHVLPMEFSIDAKTGETTAEIQYRSCILAATGAIITVPSSINDFPDYCSDNIITVKENVGDMVKSKYLIIDERNYPDYYGNVVGWERDTKYAHRIYHNVENGLFNFYIYYKNMYL